MWGDVFVHTMESACMDQSVHEDRYLALRTNIYKENTLTLRNTF